MNPHSIALTRKNTYTKYTILNIIQTLLSFADAEYSFDTIESIPKARELYQTAFDLIEEQKSDGKLCREFVISLEIEDSDGIWKPLIVKMNEDIGRIKGLENRNFIVNSILSQFANPQISLKDKFTWSVNLIKEELRRTTPSTSISNLIIDNQAISLSHQRLSFQNNNTLNEVKIVNEAIREDYAWKMQLVSGKTNAQLIRNGNISLPSIPNFMTPLRVVNPLVPSYISQIAKVGIQNPDEALRTIGVYQTYSPKQIYKFCFIRNPILDSLELNAKINLYKIRNGLNINGLRRTIDPYAAPINNFGGLPFIGDDGQLVLPGINTYLPTPFRYRVLIDRAKQLVNIAQQLESAFLNVLEKIDAESYTILKARQDLQLTQAGIRLQDLRLREARDGVELSNLQQERVEIQIEHFSELIGNGLLREEEIAKNLILAASVFQFSAAAISFKTGFSGVLQGLSSTSSGLSQLSGFYSAIASFKRREQDWKFQLTLSQKDFVIADQQIRLAEDRVDIVQQEKQIAVLQREQANETIEFLQRKFTNVDLYDWMSNILEEVFSYFLQQATSVALQATNQLAFERQETPPQYIQQDYFDPPASNSLSSLSDGGEADRRGLTGSARLLQDIFQLDQYAFDTDSRKQQLTKTISLASIAPISFQQFRETGVLTFATLMELFDRDFPGHYLRLIKRVRINVLALVPPIEGIKATLSNTGLSRIVVGETIFQTINVRRDPEVISLSSPTDATGLFELQPESEFLNPFESTGVDSIWEFKMEKASNFFDYNTIADVLMTIEYTALNSFTYRQQVIQRLGTDVSLTKAFSFRNQFADQWYDLNNPQQSSTPMLVKFKTNKEDFAINVEDLFIEQVALYLSIKDGANKKIKLKLLYSEVESLAELGGDTITDRGLASTLQGNAGSWIAMIGKSPVGEWILSFPDTQIIRSMFKDEIIEDMLLMVSYNGRTADWTG